MGAPPAAGDPPQGWVWPGAMERTGALFMLEEFRHT